MDKATTQTFCKLGDVETLPGVCYMRSSEKVFLE